MFVYQTAKAIKLFTTRLPHRFNFLAPDEISKSPNLFILTTGMKYGKGLGGKFVLSTDILIYWNDTSQVISC